MTNGGVKSAPPLFVLSEHSSSVLCCSFYPSKAYERERSSWFLSGDVDGTAILWNLTTRRPLTSFSAMEEARCHILSNANQGSSTDSHTNDGQANAMPSTTFAALGPHSRSIISVGFIPTSAPCLEQSENAVNPSRENAVSGVVSAPQPDLIKQGTAAGASQIADPRLRASMHPGPQRQRFRLTRRVASRPSEAANSCPAADGSPESVLYQQAPVSTSSICFYTHCRDQRVYIWSLSLPTLSLRLMAALTAPQHGFCPVESFSTIEGSNARTFLAVPHDTNGEITVWELEWQQMHESVRHGARCRESSRDEALHSSGIADSADLGAEANDDEEGSNDAEEVDTTGMSSMDALIARSAAQERRQVRQRSSQQNVSSPSQHVGGGTSTLPTGSVVSRAERVSFLCFVAPFATTSACGFSVRCLCSFTACPRFKGGTIMRLSMCGDAQHLTVAFESGHVVLARFRTLSVRGSEAAAQSFEQGQKLAKRWSPTLPVHVRCTVRAFAESALACWWGGRRVLACSAEGSLHCYDVSLGLADGVSCEEPCASTAPLELQLLWSTNLRKGIGSISIQANLVIAGCWDSTLRLYDARDGRLVSILSYQRESINEVRMAPSVVARAAAFGFDPRQPRCYAPPTLASDGSGGASRLLTSSGAQSGNASLLASSGAGPLHGLETEEEELVYLFASASKDGSVALWRVDMQLVAERAAMKALLA